MRRIVPLAQKHDRLPKPQMLVSSGMTRFPLSPPFFMTSNLHQLCIPKIFGYCIHLYLYIYITYIIFTCVHVFIIHWFVF